MEILAIILILIVVDIVAGIIAAIEYNEYTSAAMRKGLYHKLAVLMLLGLAFLLQYAVGQVEGLPAELAMIYPGTGLYIIIMETTSILENLVKINPQLANTKIMQIFSSKLDNEEK